ncbi:diguanylate cyclase/phosphodiesterase (GGDEF & EAL domains) with PAS/PAC sensor(s) [Nitrincola lacisaponensis]|uniref:cyclic-guanylate-specific phosphodiesterase n=1 Tax=Nitrincola lacisaponensis TaxID=267850 RepID=A0A063Y421_9GAMM|nr:EAL domain-containing protein [Nitrincola lacisaponensis]KDE40429.1 diguanylate cyclase/phosphodiesterase (GGDEF & EAL domains) with PAS/PAC sensor(s) [Nitrincola lacisaponensis]
MADRLIRVRFRAEKVALAYFLFAMLWILTSDHLLGMLVDDPALLVSLSTYKGILFVATTALLLYLVLRVWILPEQETSAQVETPRGLIIVFSGMALLVPLLALSLLQIATPQALQTARTNVEMVAGMKAVQLDQWLTHRQMQADLIQLDNSLNRRLNAWESESDSLVIVGELTDYLNRLHAYHQFDGVYLYHLDAGRGLSVGQIRHRQTDIERFIEQSQHTRAPFLVGLHPVIQGLGLSWVIPLRQPGHLSELQAVLVLSLDPEIHLYPHLSQWPVESRSAELVLLERSPSESVRLLSPSKMTQAEVLSFVNASVDAEARNEDMLTALLPLSHPHWYLLAQQSRQEVLAPVYMMAAWLALLSLATVISIMFALRLVWQQNRRLQQAAFQVQAAEKDKLLLKFFEMPFVGMAITDPESGRWLRFNPELCRLLGYPEEELKTLTWQAVTHPDSLEADQQAFQRLQEGLIDSYTLEKQFVRKSGSVFTALLNVGAVRFAGGQLQYCIATLQDISDQKRYESDILHQRDLYSTLSETNQAIIRCTHRAELFSEVCRIAVVFGKMRYACLIEVNETSIKLASAYGDMPVSLDWLARDEWVPLHQSTVFSSVIDSANPVIMNPLEGKSSQACFPVMVDTQVVALLTLYAEDTEFFSPDIIETLSEMAGDIGFAIRFIEQEEALKAAVQVVEASPVVLFRWENQPGWPVTYVSANVSRWGYSAHNFLSGEVNFDQLVHPDDRQWLVEEVALYLSQRREEYLQEYRVLTREGQELWVEDHTKVIYGLTGEVEVIEGVVTDVTSRKTIQQRIEFLARHDSLTGLPNRLDVLTSIETRGNPQTALLMLDLDRFKDVNDSFGHRTGDQLLCRVAELLRKECPADGLLARFGGDEFGVLIDRDQDALMELAEALIEALRTPIQLPQGMEIRIGACVGVARFSDAEQSAEELMRQADAALYKAKEAGREQLRFYTNELTRAALIRLDTEARLRQAMSDRQLSVYFQPQIDIETGQLLGAEALLRWQDPQLGFVSPASFIPVAEQSGLIHVIGEWVMDQVCMTGRRWLDQGYPPLRLAVNLSSFQLRHGDIVGMIRQTLEKHDYPASGLEVELTESALMRREDEAEKVFEALQAMGVSLAIDDFGTGYSSLAYLKTFPLDVLKIDKSFIEDLEVSADDREIAAAVIVMGHTLGLKVLAEGVETEAQLALLRELGCDYYQGYLKSPAVSADAFEQFFRN